MDNINDANSNDDIFICNSQECFNLNQYQTTYLRDKTIKPQNKNNIKCSFCSYDFDNLEALRNKIYAETRRNKLVKNNMLKAKILEIILAAVLCLIIFCAVFYFIMQIYFVSK